MSRTPAFKTRGSLTAFTLVVTLWAATAQAGPLIVGNNVSAGQGQEGFGPISAWDFATGGPPVASFVPTGATNRSAGRGVQVVGNRVYYTEVVVGSVEVTDFIRIAPFNDGAGGADVALLLNPDPTAGVLDLAFSNGVLYAMTGSLIAPLEVFGLNPLTGAVVSGPVLISNAAGADSSSSGFTVLPNGNFLINDTDGIASHPSCTYSQYDPSTGALILGTTFAVPGGLQCTGVDTDGVSLFFQTDNSFTQTSLSGALVASTNVSGNMAFDISLVTPACAGAAGVTPGAPSCRGRCVSSLATTYGSIAAAASDFGFASVADLLGSISNFCGN